MTPWKRKIQRTATYANAPERIDTSVRVAAGVKWISKICVCVFCLREWDLIVTAVKLRARGAQSASLRLYLFYTPLFTATGPDSRHCVETKRVTARRHSPYPKQHNTSLSHSSLGSRTNHGLVSACEFPKLPFCSFIDRVDGGVQFLCITVSHSLFGSTHSHMQSANICFYSPLCRR